MGRTIIANESTQQYIDNLIKQSKWFVGVIIGQLTTQRDYIVHLARTPDPVEDEVSEETGEDDNGDQVKSVKRKPSIIRPASIEEMDEKWVSTHAKQVLRMLPGGLNIVGLFALAPSAMLKGSQAKMRQLLFTVHKHLSKSSLSMVPEITDRILLQMDTSTKKLTCMTVDVADFKSALRPAEWKFQSGESKWVRLESQINLDIPIAVQEGSSKSQNLLKQLQTGLADFGATLKSSVVTVDGVLRDPSEPLVTQTEKKGKGSGKGGGPASSSPRLSFPVNIYMPFSSCDTHSDPVTTKSQAKINMVGTAVIRAYVSARSTVSDAIGAVKKDVMRSLLTRCELLCEEFDVTEEDQNTNGVYDPPVRLFCQLPHSSVEVCDYVFQDEKQQEVMQRIQELLDMEVDQLEESEKSAADDDTWSQSSLSGVGSSQCLVTEHSESRNTSRGYLGAAVGGIVALLATGISYFYFNE